MDTRMGSVAGLKHNKGKLAILAVYILVVFGSPLIFFTPFDQNQLVDSSRSFVPPDADQFFRQYIGLLQRGDTREALLLMSEEARQTDSPVSLHALSNYLANSTNRMDLISGKVRVATPLRGGTSTTNYDVYYKIVSKNQDNNYMIVEILAQDSGRGMQILGIWAASPNQLGEERAKSMFGAKSLYLVLAVLIPSFIAFTAFRYITKARKPGWVTFLIILFATVYLSISSDQVRFIFGIYSFMGEADPWGSWAFLTPIPLGAIYYYFVRKRHEVSY
jgi:hypothetical protein